MKITTKFRASRRLRFEDTKRIMSPEIPVPEKFRDFRETDPRGSIMEVALITSIRWSYTTISW